MGPQRSDLQRWNRVFEIIDRTCGRRKMKDKVHSARHKNEFRNVVPDESKILVSGKMFNVVRRPRNKVINRDNAEPFAQQTIAEMRQSYAGILEQAIADPERR